MTQPNLLQRIRAAFSPTLTHPAQRQSHHMPDLERWNMPHRTVDMRDWEVALNMAKNLYRPDRTKLMDLYDSVLKDAHLGSLIETRELRVQGAKFKLVDGAGNSKPEHARLLEAPWFLDFVKYVVDARFVGHSLIELGELKAPGQLRQVNLIDPRNVLPYAGVVARRQGEETGYRFRDEPLRTYLIEVGRPEDLGLLERVAPVAVVKKYAIGSWSQYTGTYGIPARWVKTRGNDARRVKQLETVMQNMLSSAYAIIQGDEEFGIAPTPSTSPAELFDKLISRMNSEMSKRLMGQDGTTDNKDASGTYGSMKVLEGVAEDRHESDKTFVQHVVNEELLPRLIALGYPFAGLRFAWDEFRDMSAGELVDAVAKLAVHYDIDPQHIEERTGIKILGARRMPGELGPGDDPNKPADPDKPADPAGTTIGDLSIQDTAMNGAQVQSLLELITKVANGEIPESVARPIIRTAFPKVSEERINEMLNGMKDLPKKPTAPEGNPPGNGKQATKPAPGGSGEDQEQKDEEDDDDDDEEDGITAQWPRESLGSCGVCGGSRDITAEGGPAPLSDEEMEAIFEDLKATDGLFSQNYFSGTADALVGGFRQAWEGNPFDFTDQPDPVAYTIMEANVYRFSGAKTRAMALELNEMARNAKGYADFKRMVEESGSFGDQHRWLQTEYANAVNCGQQASRYYAHKRMAEDLPLWEYETMEDDRVRPAHAQLNGKVFRHDDRIWDTIYPPNGWRCRCSVRPRWADGSVQAEKLNAHKAEEFLDKGELNKMAASGHNVNRAKLGEVFKLSNAYRTENTTAKAAIGVKESYGAKAADQEYKAIMARPLPQATAPAADAASAKAQVFRGQKEVILTDHTGRPWKFKAENFDHHTDPKNPRYNKEDRYKSAHLVGEVLSAPDEVWLSVTPGTGKAKHRFIRYYDGKSIAVETETILKAGAEPSMRVYTWYEMSEASSVSNRTGLLLKKNTR